MNRDELDAIKELASVKIEDILDSLGISYTPKYNYMSAACPVHCGDNKTAWSYHIDKQMWRCFTRGCQDQFGHDIFGLVVGIKECSFAEAVEFVRGFIDSKIDSEEIAKLKDQRENRQFIESITKEEEKVVFDPECLDKLEYHEYLETRGYPRSLIERYQIGACLQPYKYMSDRIVIPVCDIDGSIIGFTGRTLIENWKELGIPKWKHSKGSWINTSLFNIHFAKYEIARTGTVIVVEGPLDVLRLEEAGITNSVAIMGKKLYGGQMTLLYEAGAFSILDGLDNDTAGRIGSNGLKKSASCLFDIKKIKMVDGFKDFGEMPVELIKGIFKEDGVLC